MKKYILILIVFFVSITCFSQTAELISSGALRFLTSNPTTADRLNPSDIQAMNMISNLLLVGSKRKHEMNLANANRTEINLTSQSDGSQATIVLDAEGNVYVLSNGIVYPISEKIVEEARKEFVPKDSRENQFIPPYDLVELEENFVFEETKIIRSNEVYTVSRRGGDFMSQIAEKYNGEIIETEILYWKGRETSRMLEKMKNDQMIIKEGTKLRLVILKKIQPEKINFLFTCKWAKDFDEDGYGFEDFIGIKNSFINSEEITFVVGYQLTKEDCNYFLTIYRFDTGEEVFRINKPAPTGNRIVMQSINIESVSLGRYVFNLMIKKEGEKILSKAGKFEIIN